MREGGGEEQRDLCGSWAGSGWQWMPTRVTVGGLATAKGCGQRCCLHPFSVFGRRGHYAGRSDV